MLRTDNHFCVTDTKRWTKVVSHGKKPSRRSGASGVVYRDWMYLFGGYEGRNGSYYNDLFCYDFGMRIYAEHQRMIVTLSFCRNEKLERVESALGVFVPNNV